MRDFSPLPWSLIDTLADDPATVRFPHAAVVLWAVLWRYSEWSEERCSGFCSLGKRRLAKLAKVNHDHVDSLLKLLEAAGYVEVDRERRRHAYWVFRRPKGAPSSTADSSSKPADSGLYNYGSDDERSAVGADERSAVGAVPGSETSAVGVNGGAERPSQQAISDRERPLQQTIQRPLQQTNGNGRTAVGADERSAVGAVPGSERPAVRDVRAKRAGERPLQQDTYQTIQKPPPPGGGEIAGARAGAREAASGGSPPNGGHTNGILSLDGFLSALAAARGSPCATPLDSPGPMRDRVAGLFAKQRIPGALGEPLAGLVLQHGWICPDGALVHLDRLEAKNGELLAELAVKAAAKAEADAEANSERGRKRAAALARARREVLELVRGGAEPVKALMRVGDSSDTKASGLNASALADEWGRNREFADAIAEAEKAATKAKTSRFDFGSILSHDGETDRVDEAGRQPVSPPAPTTPGEPDDDDERHAAARTGRIDRHHSARSGPDDTASGPGEGAGAAAAPS